MLRTDLQDLFKKYLDDKISLEEFKQLYGMINKGYDQQTLDGILEEAFSNPAYAAAGKDHEPKEVFASLLAKMEAGEGNYLSPKASLSPKRWMVAAAAAVLLFLAGGIFLYLSKQKVSDKPLAGQPLDANKQARFDAPPGKSGAILTLADGKKITLDSARNETLEPQGNSQLRQQGDQLLYQTDGSALEQVVYNTMTTPRGKQYQLQLADGTKVWLNAASSIRFPAAFKGKERRVELSGEAYFEIAKNKEMPFVVEVNKSEIQVLGTRFNVMDYQDENKISTTLLEGSVRITNGSQHILLVPGEQGKIDRASGQLSSERVDVEKIIAWKKGLLCLVDSDFPVLMRQISRWYDVDVRFEGRSPNVHIGGFIHKDVNLATVLEFLGENGVRYRTEGRTITIMP